MSEPDVLPPISPDALPDASPVASYDSNDAPATVGPSGPIVATAGRYYRNARFIMVAGLIVMGAFFLYDGYKRYPEQNAKIAEVERELNVTPKDTPRWFELEAMQRKLGSPHQATDLTIQKMLGYALPVVALAYMTYFLRKSRGEIRLQDNTLTVPGHPPVPLAAIKSVDSRQWKKKGIAVVKYDLAGSGGAITLDDFVYKQVPIDAIYDRLIALTSPAAPESAAENTADSAAVDA